MNRTYKSELAAAIHETASDLSDAGLMDKQTMQTFDEECLTPVEPLTPDAIRAIRMRAQVSQAVFARYLNVSPGVVSEWERGQKRPAGASLKLLSIVQNRGLEAIA